MAHKDICIRFEIDGRRFEAVGFLNEGEISMSRVIMLERADKKNGGALVKDEDTVFLSERRIQFPTELQQYYLVTSCCDAPTDPRYILFFHWNVCDNKWRKALISPDDDWYHRTLVLRRCL